MKITVNDLKKLAKRVIRRDTYAQAVKEAREEARYNLTEELRQKYADYYENSPLKEKCILYEAFGGRGMTCSPHAIFKYLLTQPEFQEYLHVWVIDDFSDNAPWMEAYKENKNVKFIRFQSLEYREYLATSKYLVNNVSFPGYFTKREGQVFIDTWHGIPLKTIGFDIPAGKISAGNTVKNFLAADYLISPDPFMTEIYQNAFKMGGIYPGTILEIGQPRNDSYFHTEREEVFRKLKMAGIEADPDKKLILYAPTWKGSKYSSPDTSLDAYEKMIRTIEEKVDTSVYQVFVKPHQIVYYHIKNTQGVTGQYIPATVDTNELLKATDILISDYSSIYFDYLVSGKPILFFIPDLADYQNYRGLYFGIDKLPGPIAENYEQLGGYLRDLEKAMEPYHPVYEREAKWACPKDDGDVCRRLVEIVFHGKKGEECIRCKEDGRRKILMYAGDFSDNETTRTFLAMAEYLDFDKFDVTLLIDGGGDEKAQGLIRSLPDGIRVLYRGQPYNGSPQELASHNYLMKGKKAEIPHVFYKREARRLFGEAVFDCAIDFTGKKNLFSMMVSQMESTEFYTHKLCFVDRNRIQAELDEQPVIVSQKESYYIADIEGENSSVLTVDAIPAPDAEKNNYFCMYQKGTEALLGTFASLKEKNSCLYIMGKGKAYDALGKNISQLHLEGRVFLTGWLSRPFALMKMCDYFICPAGEESAGALYAKAMNMKLVGADLETEISYSFDAEEWNRKQYQELEAQMEDKRDLHE